MQLILIRHALPLRVDNAADGADPALAPLGLQQASRVGPALARHRVTRVVSSPQLRARQTAEPVAAELGLPVDVVDGLAEYDVHAHAYIPIEVAKDEFPEAYARIKSGQLPAAIDAGQFVERVVDAVNDLVAETDHLDTVVGFTHGGVINTYIQNVLGNRDPLAFPIDYCSVTRLLFSRNGRRTVAAVNETAHVWDLLPRNARRSE
ncbi:histidine phosphatase family protein [Skermania sp. ID1734]|uniref:histidine phosphatase family protein n=1 Tax=Skermania sp. ID1734 TaxID=2597516 RepID=UPI00117CCBB3|nr:histidine phosphatase family protein [Skermania sp. ID1734]TSD99182.1 histidine phosphatase family protein [Skermania sp. ID1734]